MAAYTESNLTYVQNVVGIAQNARRYADFQDNVHAYLNELIDLGYEPALGTMVSLTMGSNWAPHDPAKAAAYWYAWIVASGRTNSQRAAEQRLQALPAQQRVQAEALAQSLLARFGSK
jgi:hypothetical protein